MEYIRTTLLAQPYSPLIVLLPFVSGFSRTLNTACREMVRSGGVVIAAAGNYRENACLYSPASEPQVSSAKENSTCEMLPSLFQSVYPQSGAS